MRSTKTKFLTIIHVVAAFLALTAPAPAQVKQSPNPPPPAVKYAEMTDGEKSRFIEAQTDKILALFRRAKGDQPDRASVHRIRSLLDGYSKQRTSQPQTTTVCRFGDPLEIVLKRGSAYAPAIKAAFAEKNLPGHLGIYIAMVESEFCPCSQSPTGALGMFQFLKSNGEAYGLRTVAGASPQNPDERCQPALAAKAAALYLDRILGEKFGRNSVGFPLSVAAYNAGEDHTNSLVKMAKEATQSEDVSFWVVSTYVEKTWGKNWEELNDKDLEKAAQGEANQNKDESGEGGKDKIPSNVRQFFRENIRYVPKFFAAAIIGENPEVFEIKMTPLSRTKGR
jgi:soluble lytic murein transglycosylase-like protein